MEPHEILGVNKDAAKDEIKKAFKRKAMILHPDKGGDKDVFQEVKNARDTMLNGGKAPGPDTELADALNEVTRLFEGALAKYDDAITGVDIICEVSDVLRNSIAEVKNEQRKSEAYIKKTERIRGRMKTKGNTINVFENIIGKRISRENERLEYLGKRLTIGRRALELLNDFTFDFDKPEPRDVFLNFHGNNINFSTGA